MKASIIIPSYNAKNRLYNNLVSLNCQNYPFSNFEVIVIDNGSTDQTNEMLSDFSPNYSLITIRLDENVGIAKGRNRGILEATGEIIIFHDSDMIATKDFVRKHIEAHEEEQKRSTVICGLCWKRIYSFYYRFFRTDDARKQQFQNFCPPSTKIRKKDHSPLISEEQITSGEFIDYSFDLDNSVIASLKKVLQIYGEDLNGYKFPWRFFLTNNASISKKALLEVGLFDEKNKNWGFEDLDLAIRLHKFGYKFKIRHDIVNVHQEHPYNFSAYSFKESIRYMLAKYNDIQHLDVLLILLTTTISFIPPVKTLFDDHELNEIVNEIEARIASGMDVENLVQFQKLLQILCDIHLGFKKRDGSKTEKISVEKLQIMKEELIRQTKQEHFAHAFIKIIQEID